MISALGQIKKFYVSEVRFIEIGANHPIATSSTYLLYKNGAQGALVEANPNLIPELKRIRPRDNVINLAVVPDYSEKVDLHISSASELSSLDGEFTRKGNFNFEVHEVIEVPAIEVNALLAREYQESPCTFLSIDCEGMDFEILERINLEKYPFDFIQIEPSEHIIQGNSLRISTLLTEHGYLKIAKTPVNEIYVRKETIAIQKVLDKNTKEVRVESPASVGYRTFDVFDTLITRRYLDPHSIIFQLAEEFGFEPSLRIEADNGLRSLDQIYESIDVPQKSLVKQREIELELENLIPIRENMIKVQDGDILISDMYLPGWMILEFCRRKGLRAQCSVYASNSDKGTGIVWDKLRNTPPIYHLGDNIKSDIESPKTRNLNGVHYGDFKFRDNELHLCNLFSKDLGCLIREIRLTSQKIDSNSGIQSLALNYNLPMLIAFAVKLNQIERPITFLGRDLQALYRVFVSLTNRSDVNYLPFSRLGAAKKELANAYIESHSPSNSILVDLASTGLTHQRLDSTRDFMALIYIDDFAYSEKSTTKNEKFHYLFKSSKIGGTNQFVEQLNCASHGALKEITKTDPVKLNFFGLEVDQSELANIHQVINEFEGVIGNYPNLLASIKDVDALFTLCHSRIRDSSKTYLKFSQNFDSFETTYMAQVIDSIGENKDST
jgi:FkbM family methyltransferase